MNGRLIPLLDVALVTPLLAAYGSTSWAWLGGPLSAAVIWAFRWRARQPVRAAPASLRRYAAAGVDAAV